MKIAPIKEHSCLLKSIITNNFLLFTFLVVLDHLQPFTIFIFVINNSSNMVFIVIYIVSFINTVIINPSAFKLGPNLKVLSVISDSDKVAAYRFIIFLDFIAF